MNTQCGASPPRSSADGTAASEGAAVSAGLDTTAMAEGWLPRVIARAGGGGEDAAAAGSVVTILKKVGKCSKNVLEDGQARHVSGEGRHEFSTCDKVLARWLTLFCILFANTFSRKRGYISERANC